MGYIVVAMRHVHLSIMLATILHSYLVAKHLLVVTMHLLPVAMVILVVVTTLLLVTGVLLSVPAEALVPLVVL